MRYKGVVAIGVSGALAACGAASPATGVAPLERLVAQAAVAAARAKPPSCTALPAPADYHSCVQDGTTYLVASIGQWATLSTLRIRVNRVTTAVSYPSRDVLHPQPITAHGRFVVVNVTVANLVRGDDTCCQFNDGPFGQTQLVWGAKKYEPSDRAELVDPMSFTYQSNANIYAGKSSTGDLVYDVPAGSVTELLQHGVLIVADFNFSPENTGRVVALKLA